MKSKPEVYTPEQQSLAVREPTGVVQTPSVLEIFAALAGNPNIDPLRIQQLMELQKWAEERDAQKQYIAAMNQLQNVLPKITKRGKIEFESKRTGTSQSTPYAKFEDVMTAIGPLLREHGFTVSFGTKPLAEKGVGILIECTLHHMAGHSETNSMPLPLDTSGSKNSIQAVGSTLSYGKRYLLSAALNLITEGEDNDDAGLDFIDERQTNNIIDLVSAAEMDAASQSKFMEYMKAKIISEIHKRDYAKAITALQAKVKQVQERR